VEFGRSVQFGVVDRESLATATETADRRRTERLRIDTLTDPSRQLARLRELIAVLREDLRHQGGPA
jgi:hypothetical protein